MWQITQAKLLWIGISLLTVLAGAVAYQNTMHIRAQAEQQRKAVELQRQMEKAAQKDKNFRRPSDMRLP